ncbi:hypothetical protein ACQKOM_24300 [Peribacillus frigoritolerans]
MERKVRDSCGKSVAKEDPAGELRRRTARGKRGLGSAGVPQISSIL